MKEIIGSSVVILGYGREGRSTHQYLLKHYPDKQIAIADQNPVQPIAQTHEVFTGKDYLRNITRYDVVIRSPGVPLRLPDLQALREQGKHITSETNIFLSECEGIVIGITGTKGKSTTASLISNILSQEFPDVRLVGNIGKPALDFLDNAGKETVFVMELSSQQLEDSRYSPHIAVVLAIVAEHLDYHQKFQDYVDAKSNIVNHQKKDDYVVFNPVRKTIADIAKNSLGRAFCFSLKKAKGIRCYVQGDTIVAEIDPPKPQGIVSLSEIPLLGRGNLENVLASVSVGILMDVPIPKIKKAICEFTPLPHRLEFIGEQRGIRFYNDSISTIPQSTIHALEALGSDVQTLIAGGHDRGIDFSILGRFLAKQPVRTLILFPTTSQRIWDAVCKAMPKHSNRPHKFDVTSMNEAVKIAFERTRHGEICLLSPASSSFNLFRDYEDRGNQFKEAVLYFGKSK